MVQVSAIAAICHTCRHGAATANDGSRSGVYFSDALP
jgi:hypothetical protein